MNQKRRRKDGLKAGNMEKIKKWTELSYGNVKITDNYMINAYEKECSYLKSLEPERLLKGFKEVAGIESAAKRYPGWEETEIQGHTVGHYLTAIAQAYAYENEKEFLEKINYTIDELEKCQKRNGYLFAWKEEIFDCVENHKPVWVPWYTMHKIFEGLLSAYLLAKNQKALQIAQKLGIWVANRCSTWNEETIKTVLSVEYGGMNDCLYELYEYTKKEEYKEAAHIFDERPLFEALEKEQDILNGLHANTTIPKILGAANRYLVTGEERYLKTAESFWKIVVEHHTYVTGGNSEWEHFGRPDTLDAERTACNCETCNTYNMLKLSKRLFMTTGKDKYMGFYENTFTNAIIPSQNPQTGMTMYFQPMATGYFKAYSTPYDKFWCCTGTGMENFTKLCEGIYFSQGDNLYIARFISSKLILPEEGFEMEVDSMLPYGNEVKITIYKKQNQTQNLFLRMPDWARDGMVISRDQATMRITRGHDYIPLFDLKQGEVITLSIPMEVTFERLKDSENTVAFSYGPVVLCAKMGTDMMNTTVTGVDVTVAQKEFFMKDYLVIEDTPEEWLSKIKQNLVQKEGSLEFSFRNTDEDHKLTFVPYFSQHKERYGIYFRLYQKGSGDLLKYHQLEEKGQLVEKEAIDIIPVGNDQYELAHHIRGEKTDFYIRNGHRCRFIEYEGFISYQLKIEADSDILCVTFLTGEEIAKPLVEIGDITVEHSKKIRESEDGFYTVAYLIPPEAIVGNNTINVKFQNKVQDSTSRIYDHVYICKTK